MRTSNLIPLILVLVYTASQCPIDPASLSPSLNCVKNIQCASPSANDSRILFQNCNKKWYYGTSTMSIIELTSPIPFTFVNNGLLAINMKSRLTYSLINFDNVTLFYYPLNTANFHTKVASDCSFLDYDSREISTSEIMIMKVCLNEVATVILNGSFVFVNNTNLMVT